MVRGVLCGIKDPGPGCFILLCVKHPEQRGALDNSLLRTPADPGRMDCGKFPESHFYQLSEPDPLIYWLCKISFQSASKGVGSFWSDIEAEAPVSGWLCYGKVALRPRVALVGDGSAWQTGWLSGPMPEKTASHTGSIRDSHFKQGSIQKS